MADKKESDKVEESGCEIFVPDMFASEVEEEVKVYPFSSQDSTFTVSICCVHEENQFIEQFVSRVVWPSSEALSSFFCDKPHLVNGKKIVELGSGTGLCALVTAKLNADSVLLTDYSADAIDVISNSIGRNQLSNVCSVSSLRWGDDADSQRILGEFGGSFDLCIGTDVVYEPESVEPMFHSAFDLLKPSGRFYLANHIHRYAALEESVQACATKMGLVEEKMDDIGEGIFFSVFSRVSS